MSDSSSTQPRLLVLSSAGRWKRDDTLLAVHEQPSIFHRDPKRFIVEPLQSRFERVLHICDDQLSAADTRTQITRFIQSAECRPVLAIIAAPIVCAQNDREFESPLFLCPTTTVELRELFKALVPPVEVPLFLIIDSGPLGPPAVAADEQADSNFKIPELSASRLDAWVPDELTWIPATDTQKFRSPRQTVVLSAALSDAERRRRAEALFSSSRPPAQKPARVLPTDPGADTSAIDWLRGGCPGHERDLRGCLTRIVVRGLLGEAAGYHGRTANFVSVRSTETDGSARPGEQSSELVVNSRQNTTGNDLYSFTIQRLRESCGSVESTLKYSGASVLNLELIPAR